MICLPTSLSSFKKITPAIFLDLSHRVYMIHPYLAICHKFPVFSFYLPHCDLLLDFQIQNISLIESKAGNRCTFLIEGNPNTPTCYLMLITNGSLGTATGPVSDASLCLPYTQTRQQCPLFSKHITILHAAVFAHGVPSASVFPLLFHLYLTFTHFSETSSNYFDFSSSLVVHIF